MNEPIVSPPVEQDKNTRRPGMPAVAIWLSVAALVACALLAVPYRALASLALVPVFAAAASAGIAGIVLGIRARRTTSVRGGWALVCALTATLIAVVLAVIFIVGMIAATSINKVELRGQGPEGISATFANDMEHEIVEWPSEGRAKFNTKGSWAELTIDAPEDAALEPVSCQIIWNGEVVVDEASTGSVTCRYDAR